MSDDMFESAGKVNFSQRPTIKMLSRGGVERKATYAAGDPAEVTVAKCVGRTVLVIPKKVDRKHVNPQYPDNAPVDRWTADVVVLDGEPISEIVDKDGDVTAELEEPLVPPFLVSDLYISNQMLGQQMDGVYSRKLAGTGSGKILAQIMVLPPAKKGGNKPYAFGDASSAAKETALQWLKDNPEPDEFDS